MKSRQHRKLKRHPLVRVIRSILRLFRVLLRPKRKISQIDLIKPVNLESIAQSNLEREKLITVGDLLSQVKWQSPLSIKTQESLDRTRNSQKN
jgi:hypothetical protein